MRWIQQCFPIVLALSLVFEATVASADRIAPKEALNGRAFSLRAAQAYLQEGKFDPATDKELNQIGGITRLYGYVLDEKQQDIILIGRRDPGVSPLGLQDFLVAFRNADLSYAELRGNIRYYSNPGVSLDPDPDVLRELNQLMQRLRREPDLQRKQAILKEWHQICERPQDVRVDGIPPSTHFAKVMLTADYDMKGLVDGTDSLSLSGFESFMDMVYKRAKRELETGEKADVPLSMLNRFWFYPDKTQFVQSDHGMILTEVAVMLLTEEEHIGRTGGVQGKNRAHPLAASFCRNMTEHYEAIAKERPIYQELSGLVQLTCCASLLVSRLGGSINAYGLDPLLHQQALPDADVPPSLPGRSAIRELSRTSSSSRSYLWLPSCGGVSLDCGRENRREDHGFPMDILADARVAVLGAPRLPYQLSWNYGRGVKTDLRPTTDQPDANRAEGPLPSRRRPPFAATPQHRGQQGVAAVVVARPSSSKLLAPPSSASLRTREGAAGAEPNRCRRGPEGEGREAGSLRPWLPARGNQVGRDCRTPLSSN